MIFKDSTKEFGLILEELSSLKKMMVDLEKRINGLSDDVMQIKEHLGLTFSIRDGKRDIGDIARFVTWLSDRDPDITDEQIFRHIQYFLMANENIYSPYKVIGDQALIIENSEMKKKIEDWEKENTKSWLQKIRNWRS